MESGRKPQQDEIETAARESVERLSRLRQAAIILDTQPSLLAVARRLRQQLPGDERFGDPLSTAGETPAQLMARGISALRPERESVLQELGLAGLQIWQSVSEAAGRGRGDVEMAVLFTDLAGFSTWALRAGDGAALELLRQVGTAVESVIVTHEGRVAKRLGDGLMATFLDAQAAVAAALEAHESLDEIEVDGHRPTLRAGVHWGRPRRIGGDFVGIDVNVAARVVDAAKPGQVVITDRVLERIDLDGIHAARAKRLRADGAPRDLQVVRIERD